MKKRITFTLEENLIQELKEVSVKTMIPQSKLVEKAIQQILKDYKNNPPI